MVSTYREPVPDVGFYVVLVLMIILCIATAASSC
jgi:hypothetical protein